ncbi:hypothetical protein FQA39_LY11967 [Lamprigera yunnana]|nr:hypothetical protein FQA39_LY11967 [Lamprigera yunnana]
MIHFKLGLIVCVIAFCNGQSRIVTHPVSEVSTTMNTVDFSSTQNPFFNLNSNPNNQNAYLHLNPNQVMYQQSTAAPPLQRGFSNLNSNQIIYQQSTPQPLERINNVTPNQLIYQQSTLQPLQHINNLTPNQLIYQQTTSQPLQRTLNPTLQPITSTVAYARGFEQDNQSYEHPKYEFQYAVADPYTKDQHSHHEIRDGNVVQGEYSVHDPDGTIRSVKYTADDKRGFNAQVTKYGQSHYPETRDGPHFAVFAEDQYNNQP